VGRQRQERASVEPLRAPARQPQILRWISLYRTIKLHRDPDIGTKKIRIYGITARGHGDVVAGTTTARELFDKMLELYRIGSIWEKRSGFWRAQ
jgi:hypothetical protein